MPTKTKTNPIVALSRKLRNVMCKHERDGDIPQKKINAWKKMGIACEWVEALVGLEATHEAVKFSNKHYGSVVVLLMSEATHDEEMELAMGGEGRIDRVLVAAVPLTLAQKIVKKGSI